MVARKQPGPLRWLIGLADDAADTEYDEEISQVMIYGGVYIAPADTFKLYDNCLALINVIFDSGNEQEMPSRSPAETASAGPAA